MAKNAGKPPISEPEMAVPTPQGSGWDRINDLSIKRPLLKPASEFERYWMTHAPTADDLAALFRVSARRIRELWQEGWLTKGGDLTRSISEWKTYQTEVLGSDRHVGGVRRRGFR